MAASGGNDSSVKLWDVGGIVQAFSSASVTSHLLPTVSADAVDAPRDSKAEGIREVRVVAADTVLVTSNWGFVWRFAPPRALETCFARRRTTRSRRGLLRGRLRPRRWAVSQAR